MPPSTPSQSWSVILPARSSSQYFQLSLPEPSTLPCQLPRSIGPAGRKIAGMFMLVAPSSRPGVVLSQPPISTAPSIGCERSSSSVSIASMLRYIIVVGLTKLSLTDSAGSSTGKPPAIRMPRLTSSTRVLKCAWQGCRSDQVLTMAITGLPVHSSGA